jgi:type II secretory pathway pseudopilin PulG
LIELLVSVSIISALVSLLLPALSAARRQGQRTTCQTRLREVSQALWAYSVANDSRVPYVESPMTNGVGNLPGFGNKSVSDALVNPYDVARWPLSLQNVLLSLYLGNAKQLFVCPAARLGWPRNGGAWELTYRDAGANQPKGVVSQPGTYDRENFGFLDGRPMHELRIQFTGDPLRDAELIARTRGTYVRDLVLREGIQVVGPHAGGINVINRDFGVEYRNRQTIQDDLAPNGGGVKF